MRTHLDQSKPGQDQNGKEWGICLGTGSLDGLEKLKSPPSLLIKVPGVFVFIPRLQ